MRFCFTFIIIIEILCFVKEWLMTRRNTSPMTNLEMIGTQLVPRDDLKARIRAFKQIE